MKINIIEDNVMTLDSVAQELAPLYKWNKFKAHKDKIEFWAQDDANEVHGFINDSGWAEDQDGNFLSDWCVNFCDDLDFTDIIWAEDENGNTVLLHN